MSTATEAASLLKASEDVSKREALKVARSRWSSPLVQRAALERIKAAQAELAALVATLDTSTSSSEVREAAEAQAEAVTAGIETILKTAASADMRLAQLQGLRKQRGQQVAELRAADNASAADRAKIAAGVSWKARKAAEALRDFVANPADYVVPASRFWNREIQALSKLRFGKSLASLTIPEGEALIGEMFGASLVTNAQLNKAISGLKNAARFLGVAAAGLIVTSLVLRSVADGAHYAEAFTKATLSLGASLAVSQVVTSAAVMQASSALSTALAPFGSALFTVEVPPVAAVLVATGLVLLIGQGLAELFDFLIDTWFGGEIPPSMRLEMTSPMESSMRSQMTSPMFSSMS